MMAAVRAALCLVRFFAAFRREDFDVVAGMLRIIPFGTFRSHALPRSAFRYSRRGRTADNIEADAPLRAVEVDWDYAGSTIDRLN